MAGNPETIQCLLDSGSDVFAIDKNQFTCVMNASKSGNVFALNTIYQFVDLFFGEEESYRLTMMRDIDGHSALDWASFSGSVNCIELLLRKGLNPNVCDAKGRNSVYWAVDKNHTQAAVFLVKNGANPKCALEKALVSPHVNMIWELLKPTPLNWFLRCAAACGMNVTKEQLGFRDFTSDPEDDPFVDPSKKQNDKTSSKKNKSDVKEEEEEENDEAEEDEEDEQTLYLGRPVAYKAYKNSNEALERTIPTRPMILLSWSLYVTIVWMSSLVVPWYGFIAIVALAIYLPHSTVKQYQKRAKQAMERHRVQLLPNLVQLWCMASEKYSGFWFGCVCSFSIHWIRLIFNYYHQKEVNSDYVLAGSTMLSNDKMRLEFLIMCGITVLKLCFWSWLVFIETDPGIIKTRKEDFQEVLNDGLNHLAEGEEGFPDSRKYCKTSLVKKPLRSKFCSQSGYVVARMDHWCVWLNSTVAHNNHRTFMIFITLHLTVLFLNSHLSIASMVHEMKEYSGGADNWHQVLNFFFVYSFSQARCYYSFQTLFNLIVNAWILFLNIEQWSHTFSNITTNEAMNFKRYEWMISPNGDGKMVNRYQRTSGCANFCEFWRVGSFYKDYTQEFELPPLPDWYTPPRMPRIIDERGQGSVEMYEQKQMEKQFDQHIHGGHDHSHGHSHNHDHHSHSQQQLAHHHNPEALL